MKYEEIEEWFWRRARREYVDWAPEDVTRCEALGIVPELWCALVQDTGPDGVTVGVVLQYVVGRDGERCSTVKHWFPWNTSGSHVEDAFALMRAKLRTDCDAMATAG